MITVKKLHSLKRRNRFRHIIRLMEGAEKDLASGKTINTTYFRAVTALLLEDSIVDPLLHREIESLKAGAAITERGLNTIRHRLLAQLGSEPADWDFSLPSGKLDPKHRRVLPIKIYLDDIRSPFNVGSIFRTAESFGVEEVLLSPGSASPAHPRAVRTAMGCVEALPWKTAAAEELDHSAGIFALETGGTPLHDFSFPPEGIMIIGSEELGISPLSKEKASRSFGIVSIPTSGSKFSLNVSVACGIALFSWYSRLAATGEEPSQSQAD